MIKQPVSVRIWEVMHIPEIVLVICLMKYSSSSYPNIYWLSCLE